MIGKHSATLALALGASTIVTACDQPQDPAEPKLTPRVRGGIGSGTVLTLNTNQWVSSSARDVYEYSPQGTWHINSFGYRTRLETIQIDDPEHYGLVVTDVANPDPGQPNATMQVDADELEVVVTGPQPGDEAVVYRGADLIGLQLRFAVTNPVSPMPYPVVLEVVGTDDDELAGALYDIHKVDPMTGALIAPLCEEDANLERYARIYDGLGVDPKNGVISHVEDGTLHHIACLSSAPGKAAAYGYPPETNDLPVFTLANRVIRADYCADGHPYTYPGNSLAMYDNFTPGEQTSFEQVKAIPDTTLEAVWGLGGVICVDNPRTSTLDRAEIVCPVKILADGTPVHNWQPPSCDNYVDPADPNKLRIYSKTVPDDAPPPPPPPPPA